MPIIGGLSTEPVKMKQRKVTLSIEVTVAVLECRLCKRDGEFVPSTLYRAEAEKPWALNGVLYPTGWSHGYCPECKAQVDLMTGQKLEGEAQDTTPEALP